MSSRQCPALSESKIRVHVINNNNNKTRGGRVERDAGGDEKQSTKSAWLNINVNLNVNTHHISKNLTHLLYIIIFTKKNYGKQHRLSNTVS